MPLDFLLLTGIFQKMGRHFDLTSKDKSLILTFKKCLGISGIKIGRKHSGSQSKKIYFRVQIGNVIFYNGLLSIGLTPNKSKTISALKIPNAYFFDFLRGCWDGDGTFYAYWDPRWESSYMFYISFASASPPFLKWIQETLRRLTHSTIEGKINFVYETSQLRFAKAGSELLFRKMFYSKNAPHLQRKFAKAKKIFRINKHSKRLL